MNRADFMKNLAELLADVPLTEREEAIQYYNDYFDDAGAENEQSVIASLGTPEQLARTIKAGLADGENIGEFTEKGFSGYEQKSSNEVLDLNRAKAENGGGSAGKGSGNGSAGNPQGSQGYNVNQGSYGSQGYSGNQGSYGDRKYGSNQGAYGSQGYNGSQGSYYNQGGAYTKQNKKQMSGGTIAAIVILCILASPLIIGVGGGLLGAAIGIFGALFGIVVGAAAAAVSLIVVGICLFAYGVVLMFSLPLGGLCMIGGAMICLAIGLFFLWLTVMICGMLIPAIFKTIAKLFRGISNKGGREA